MTFSLLNELKQDGSYECTKAKQDASDDNFITKSFNLKGGTPEFSGLGKHYLKKCETKLIITRE